MILDDITSVAVEDVTFNLAVNDIEILVEETSVAEIAVVTDSSTGEITEIATPGMQGPAGLQNVFVRSTPPPTPALNDIWIQI